MNAKAVASKSHNSGLFKGTKKPRSLTKYNLYKGITDFGALEQFNIYQGGRSFLKILQYPEFLYKLVETSPDYRELVENALHIIEFEFKGLDGLDDITTNTMEISDGFNSINVINSVREQSAATVSMRYTEKSGTPLTKFTELFLQGIFDSRSTFKTYHGLIEMNQLDDGFENEIFTFLYWVTDPTGFLIEQAYLLLGAQVTSSDKSIYSVQKGDYDAKETTLQFNCFPARSARITELALSMNQSMQIVRSYEGMEYSYAENWTSPYENIRR